MNAKEAKLIVENGMGPVFKQIRKAVEKNGDYIEFEVSDKEELMVASKILEDLGYNVESHYGYSTFSEWDAKYSVYVSW